MELPPPEQQHHLQVLPFLSRPPWGPSCSKQRVTRQSESPPEASRTLTGASGTALAWQPVCGQLLCPSCPSTVFLQFPNPGNGTCWSWLPTMSLVQDGSLTGRLTVIISFQEADLNSHLMQINDSRFLVISISVHNVFIHLLQHFHFVHPGTKARLRRLHQPFGTPGVLQAGVTFCLLHNSDYLNGYSRNRLMPLWVSYTIQPVVSYATCVSCEALSLTGMVVIRTASLSNTCGWALV